ncbi:MAG: D-2-hydroxyacid dehydrogenase, partial [Ruminococcaceae bacterium]|nr:D-2-hydroxyacid dehydrogenase [Oscillospiraceae bacterium]
MTKDFRIVLPDNDTVTGGDLDLSRLEQFGEVVCYGLTPAEELTERIKDANAVICNKTQMTAEVMAQCPNLEYIGLFATGYNNIDIE